MEIITNNNAYEILQPYGWTPVPGAAIAEKTYESAVGKKVATAWFVDYGEDETEVVLSGEYFSKGQNILSTSNVLIPKSCDMDEFRNLVDQFAKNVDIVVGESYAVRLLNNNTDIPVNDAEIEEEKESLRP